MNTAQIQAMIEKMAQQKEAFEEAKVKCGIIGLSGAGKSSLINAIAGEKIAPVGSTETTMEAQSFFHNGIEFVDLPGCGTQRWPQSTYVEDLKLAEYDCFIIVTNTRLYESDIFLYKELMTNRKKPCFIVRNKIDEAIKNEARDNDLTEEQTLSKITSSIISSLPSTVSKVYLTSAHFPFMWDLGELISAIISSQEGVKKDRFVVGMATWSKDILEKKRLVAAKIVSWSAAASAANGLNPVIGADVAVDVSILLNMCKQINDVFGLTDKHILYMEKYSGKLEKSIEYNALKQNIIKWIAKYASVEAILLILRSMGKNILVKNISKFLPILGNLISAGVGYKMTAYFGEQYLNEAEDLAEKMLDSFMNSSGQYV